MIPQLARYCSALIDLLQLCVRAGMGLAPITTFCVSLCLLSACCPAWDLVATYQPAASFLWTLLLWALVVDTLCDVVTWRVVM